MVYHCFAYPAGQAQGGYRDYIGARDDEYSARGCVEDWCEARDDFAGSVTEIVEGAPGASWRYDGAEWDDMRGVFNQIGELLAVRLVVMTLIKRRLHPPDGSAPFDVTLMNTISRVCDSVDEAKRIGEAGGFDGTVISVEVRHEDRVWRLEDGAWVEDRFV